MEFHEFPKIPRLNRECVITEKIDGTNGLIYIQDTPGTVFKEDGPLVAEEQGLFIYAGSRNQWITPEKDNYGFAKWVKANAWDLIKLGPGAHYGEWWGQNIQRSYGLKEKRFSLFNTSRWVDTHTNPARIDASPDYQFAPGCCHVVPILYKGPFDTQIINTTMRSMEVFGSTAAPGFPDAEGIIIYHSAANKMFKATVKGDEQGKHADGQIKKEKPVRLPKNPNIGGRRKEQWPFAGPGRRKTDAQEERTNVGVD